MILSVSLVDNYSINGGYWNCSKCPMQFVLTLLVVSNLHEYNWGHMFLQNQHDISSCQSQWRRNNTISYCSSTCWKISNRNHRKIRSCWWLGTQDRLCNCKYQAFVTLCSVAFNVWWCYTWVNFFFTEWGKGGEENSVVLGRPSSSKRESKLSRRSSRKQYALYSFL